MVRIFKRMIVTGYVAATCWGGFAPGARAQVPVIDEGMIQHNAAQSVQQVAEGLHENDKIDYFLRLLVKLSAYDWRSFDDMVLALEDVMEAGDAMGYSRDDFVELFEETFLGYEDYANWAEHHDVRIRRVASSFEAALLSLAEQHERWEDDLGQLESLQLKVLTTISLGDPNGEGSKQTMMEIRAAARLFAQEEMMLIRQAMMNRNLIRNLSLGTAAHRRGHAAAAVERMLGTED